MNTLTTIIFYVGALVTILFALAAVTVRNVFRAGLALTAALSLVAGFFILLGADFLAAAQVLVYVGGVMIIMLFVIMLSQQPTDSAQPQTNSQWWIAALLSAGVGAALVVAFKDGFSSAPLGGAQQPTSAAIGHLLLGDMLVPFEAISLVLLAALVGAVLFAGPDQEKSR